MDSRPRRRWPFVLLLLGSLFWLGLVAGTVAGTRWFMPEGSGSGMAGPVIALGYGVLGAGLGLAVGGGLAWKAGSGLLRTAALITSVMALLIVGLVAWRAVSKEAEHQAKAGLDIPLPPPAGFRIESQIAESDSMRRYRELTIDGDTWTAKWTVVGPEATTCTAALKFAEADALLHLRMEWGGDSKDSTPLCSVSESAATHTYSLYESDSEESSWQVFADARCLQESSEVAELYRVLGQIPVDALSDSRVECDF